MWPPRRERHRWCPAARRANQVDESPCLAGSQDAGVLHELLHPRSAPSWRDSVRAWVGGGWGVAALAGRQSRGLFRAGAAAGKYDLCVIRYPDIEPYETGLLDTGDGNLVYWETCGNPKGVPALIVHGGPGSGCTTGNRGSFDSEKFRIIIFDQRNCGRSRPHASDPAADMSLNTTGHLLADMEQLREHLGVEKWLLRGGSWGATLSLAYAERHPERVSGMLMLSVTSTRRLELDWLYRGVGRFFPEAWARFRDFPAWPTHTGCRPTARRRCRACSRRTRG
jgi:hypothetical protein